MSAAVAPASARGHGRARRCRTCPATGRPTARAAASVRASASPTWAAETGERRRHSVPAVGAREDAVREAVDRAQPAVRRDHGSAGPLLRAAGRSAHLPVADQDEVHSDPRGGLHPVRARPVLPGRLAERQASRRSRSAVVGALDRPLRERRHAGRGHGRIQRQDVAGSDGPSAHRAAASDRALQARRREARWSSTW